MTESGKRPGVADRLAEVAGDDFRRWLREDPAALGQMLHAPMMEALEAAFAMGMMRGMVMAGRKMRGAGQSPSKDDDAAERDRPTELASASEKTARGQ